LSSQASKAYSAETQHSTTAMKTMNNQRTQSIFALLTLHFNITCIT